MSAAAFVHRRRTSRAAALVALTLLALALPAPARGREAIVVSTNEDTRGGPLCSLPDAISAANEDRASGGCPAGDGADTVVLDDAAYLLIAPFDSESVSPKTALVVTSAITIEGNGAVIESLGGRVLTIRQSGDLTLRNLTIRNGSLPVVAPGGGVNPRGVTAQCGTNEGPNIQNCGQLTLRGVTVSGGYGMVGGGIHNTGTLDAAGCVIADNRVQIFSGGGIYNAGVARLEDCTVRGNQTPAADAAFEEINGAGVYSTGPLTIVTSTFSDNLSDSHGGAIYSTGPVTITTSTFSGNTARGDGGAIYSAGRLTVTGATIAGNSADSNANGFGDGGGLFVANGEAVVTRSIIAGNADTTGNEGPGNRYPDVAADNGTALAVTAAWDQTTFPPDLDTLYTMCITGPGFSAPSCGIFGAFPNPAAATVTWRNLRPGEYTVTALQSSRYVSPSLPTTVAVTAAATAALSVPVTRRTAVRAGSLAFASAAAPAGVSPPALSSGGHNLIGDASGSAAFSDGVNGDRVGGAAGRIDPRLGPLADNGGATFTRAPLIDSPALDTGGQVCGELDQRRAPRPIGPACDVGAVEIIPVHVYLGVVLRQ